MKKAKPIETLTQKNTFGGSVMYDKRAVDDIMSLLEALRR